MKDAHAFIRSHVQRAEVQSSATGAPSNVKSFGVYIDGQVIEASERPADLNEPVSPEHAIDLLAGRQTKELHPSIAEKLSEEQTGRQQDTAISPSRCCSQSLCGSLDVRRVTSGSRTLCFRLMAVKSLAQTLAENLVGAALQSV